LSQIVSPQHRIFMSTIVAADDMTEVAALFRAYADDLGVAEVLPDFDAELAALPGDYAPPGGALLLARDMAGLPLGCIALKPLAPGVGEIKRLYVCPPGRGKGIGKALVAAILGEALRREYREVKLDTLAKLVEAQALYRSFGFVAVAPFRSNPYPGILFFGKAL
jgi:GNAT superfamily N-acetyltransferase